MFERKVLANMLLSLGLVVLWTSVNCLINYADYLLKAEMNRKLCLNPPPPCTCIDRVYSCPLGNSQDEAVIKLNFDNDFIYFECLNVSSFETFPDLTKNINVTGIGISNCLLSINKTLNELTSKMSKQVKNITIDILEKEKLTLNKNLFEGFSMLENLIIKFVLYQPTMSISTNVFEKLINLKTLVLWCIQTPNDLFDPLEYLQVLSIHSKQIKLENGIFKNQRNLIDLNLDCRKYDCTLDPLIFANLTNLEKLNIKGNFSIHWSENVLKNNEKLKSIQLTNVFSFQFTQTLLTQNKDLKYVNFNHNQLESLPEHFFKNLSNIDKIILSSNQLTSLSRDLFVDQTMLSELDLGYNNLTELDDGLFKTTKNMKTLILTSNLLTKVSR